MRVLCWRSSFCMCREREYILLLLREMETGFSAIWNRETQKQPLMASSVSFWLYKLAGKSYYSGPGEYRSGWQLSPWFVQLQQPNGLEPELQLHGRSFSHKDFTADKLKIKKQKAWGKLWSYNLICEEVVTSKLIRYCLFFILILNII
jgi:hypothetical protein